MHTDRDELVHVNEIVSHRFNAYWHILDCLYDCSLCWQLGRFCWQRGAPHIVPQMKITYMFTLEYFLPHRTHKAFNEYGSILHRLWIIKAIEYYLLVVRLFQHMHARICEILVSTRVLLNILHNVHDIF